MPIVVEVPIEGVMTRVVVGTRVCCSRVEGESAWYEFGLLPRVWKWGLIPLRRKYGWVKVGGD